MTTLIVVAIVGLVFFVTVCVAGFMVWKRETELRTDTMGAIERSLGEVASELSGMNAEMDAEISGAYGANSAYGHSYDAYGAPYSPYDSNTGAYGKTNRNSSRRTNNSRKEPFDWVRQDERNVGNVSVFRPSASTSQRLRWTEVSGDETPAGPASRIAGRFRRKSQRSADENPAEYSQYPKTPADANQADGQNIRMNADPEAEFGFSQGFGQRFESGTAPEYGQDSEAGFDTGYERGYEAGFKQGAEQRFATDTAGTAVAADIAGAAGTLNAASNAADMNSYRQQPKGAESRTENINPEALHDPNDEINLSTIDLDNLDSISLDEFDLFNEFSDTAGTGSIAGTSSAHAGYNTGRSGKTYTAQELESLIKE